MDITIIGCGNAGSTLAADLSLKGHSVTLLKTSNAMHNEHYIEIKNTKCVKIIENGKFHIAPVFITTDIETAIKEKKVIILCIQTNYHEDIIRRITPYLSDDQVILVEPGYFATCFFRKYCSKDIVVVEAESSPIDCRIIEPGVVKVFFRNICNPVGVYPNAKQPLAKAILDEIGFPFKITSDVVEAALHNPNLIIHTVGGIFSIPRIEYVAKNGGKYSMYKEVFTEHIWNLVLKLDDEKMSILEKAGCRRLPYVEACKLRNSLDVNRNATEVFFDYANNAAPSGPNVPDSRYITEDVPQGLVLLEALGSILKIQTPICSSLIDCASALIGRDFRAEGRTVERLGIENINAILNDKN